MKRLAITFIASMLCMVASAAAHNDKVLDISGKWQFQTDPKGVGVQEKWFNRDLDDTIELPGSMVERLKGDDVDANTKWTGSTYDSTYYHSPFYEQYRQPGNIKFPFFLTPEKHYVGVAWYRRTVDIPADWQGSHIVLFLERPHISTQVWVDGVNVGGSNSLSVPHTLDLSGVLTPGRHSLSIRVDNNEMVRIVNANSHSVSDQTQGNWNGIVGRMELQSSARTYMDDIQIYPDLAGSCAKVKLTFESPAEKDVTVKLDAASFNSTQKHKVKPVSHKLHLPAGRSTVEIDLPMPGYLAWDEFSPALYHLNATLTSDEGVQKDGRDFGMREFTIDGKMFRINGRITQLRGTVGSCCFPMTGYPPTNVEEWEAIFKKCREYGLNHMRFHSYCPPEAAFIAADKLGFYLQPEGPSWPNHGVGLGVGQPIDEYLMFETQEMVRTLGNHPSFCMLACGNEPAGRWVEWVTDFVHYWEATDSRRVYTGASVGGGWAWQPENQYHVKAGARGLEWAGSRPATMDDFSQGIKQAENEPWVTHEMGQWCVFPNLDETVKYTGAYKARNFEIFRDILAVNDMGDQGHDFLMASGYLQQLCYKYDLERHMRTPQYAGFQLLALNDYSGQGSAIVGVLDVLWGEKGYCDAASWTRFCSPVVPLARLEKFVYKNAETLHAELLTTNYGPADMNGTKVQCVIKDDSGKVVRTFDLGSQDVRQGGNTVLGSIDLKLSELPSPAHYNMEVTVGSEGRNDWDFWVYPDEVEASADGIYVCSTLDEKAVRTLSEGGDVLVLAPRGVSAGRGIQQQFLPVFWNTSWFMMRPPHTTGILVDTEHPLWRGFPTESHSDLQWWELVNRAPVMQFSDFPQGFRPLVQSIDTWFLSRKIGSLFEARVLNGRLMMSTMDLERDLEGRPVAAQLKAAILKYMHSADFKPAYNVPLEDVQGLFTRTYAPTINFTKATPDELVPGVK